MEGGGEYPIWKKNLGRKIKEIGTKKKMRFINAGLATSLMLGISGKIDQNIQSND